MRIIDELHLECPYAGSRMLRDLLNLLGIRVGRRRVRTLMRRMGIEALYRKPNTSKKHPEHAVYPYLLRHLKVERPNLVWAMDITFIPMARGFIYLAAVVDWYSHGEDDGIITGDGVHLTGAGQQLFADSIAEAIEELFADS